MNDPVGAIVASLLVQWPYIGIGVVLTLGLEHGVFPLVIRAWIHFARRDGAPRHGG